MQHTPPRHKTLMPEVCSSTTTAAVIMLVHPAAWVTPMEHWLRNGGGHTPG